MKSMQHLFEQLEFLCTELCEIFLGPLAWYSLHYLWLWSQHVLKIKAIKTWAWCTNVTDSFVFLRRQGLIADSVKATEVLFSTRSFLCCHPSTFNMIPESQGRNNSPIYWHTAVLANWIQGCFQPLVFILHNQSDRITLLNRSNAEKVKGRQALIKSRNSDTGIIFP